MATTADIKNGLVIKFNNDLFSITEFLHVKPGKGPAFVRTKLKSLTTGKVIDNTFNSGVNIFPVRVERRVFQYLYAEEFGYTFMDNETFEQIEQEFPDEVIKKIVDEIEKAIKPTYDSVKKN